jgi:hypothetical protein
MIAAGKNQMRVSVAIVRELAGFPWDLVRREMPRVRPQTA